MIFSEIHIITPILSLAWWHTEYDRIRFLTGDKKDHIDLESVITEKHRSKSFVTSFNLSENPKRYRNFS